MLVLTGISLEFKKKTTTKGVLEETSLKDDKIDKVNRVRKIEIKAIRIDEEIVNVGKWGEEAYWWVPKYKKPL